MISKPPRGPSEKRLSSKVSAEMSVAGVGQKGDQGSAKNESNSSRKISLQNTARQPGDSKKSLPNLLKNSQSQHYRSQKSTQSGGQKARQDSGQPVAEKSQSSNKEGAAEGGPEEGAEKANTLSTERNRRSRITNEVIEEEEVENEQPPAIPTRSESKAEAKPSELKEESKGSGANSAGMAKEPGSQALVAGESNHSEVKNDAKA